MSSTSGKTDAEPNSGSYLLVLRLRNRVTIPVGALGMLEFPEGYYTYTGSAMKNLRQRVARHLRRDKKIHWHIDYLAESADCEIVDSMVFPSAEKEECLRNQAIEKKLGARPIAKGFGSSDCHECQSHLLYLGDLVDNNIIRRLKAYIY